MEARPQIVCLCGSARYAEELRAANRELTLAGAIVLAPAEFERGEPKPAESGWSVEPARPARPGSATRPGRPELPGDQNADGQSADHQSTHVQTTGARDAGGQRDGHQNAHEPSADDQSAHVQTAGDRNADGQRDGHQNAHEPSADDQSTHDQSTDRRNDNPPVTDGQLTSTQLTGTQATSTPYPSTQITDEQKAALGALHLAKIDLADRVLVVNPGGYVGESTRREIRYAHQTGKPVDYTDPPGSVVDPGSATDP